MIEFINLISDRLKRVFRQPIKCFITFYLIYVLIILVVNLQYYGIHYKTIKGEIPFIVTTPFVMKDGWKWVIFCILLGPNKIFCQPQETDDKTFIWVVDKKVFKDNISKD